MIRIALYEKEPKTLQIKVEYDELTIGKIKRIPGRQYHKNEGKIWTIPYKYIKRLTDMFDDSEIIYEPGVNKNYEETDNYDFESEIKLFRDPIFKAFTRYIVSETSDEESDYTVTRTKIAHALSQSRDTTTTEHDILIIASILYKTDIAVIEECIKNNYDDLDIDTKRVYNMYWSDIVKTIKQQNCKLHKILKDAEYLTTMGFVSTV